LKNLGSFRDAVRLSRCKWPHMCVSHLDMVLTIALNPGISQRELGEECGSNSPAVSRAIDVLSGRGRKDKVSGALGLVTAQFNESDRRIRRLYLTEEGQQFAASLSAAAQQ